MGFLHVQHNRLLDDFKVAYDARGNIKTENYTTSVGGVFAAGDADIGASLSCAPSSTAGKRRGSSTDI